MECGANMLFETVTSPDRHLICAAGWSAERHEHGQPEPEQPGKPCMLQPDQFGVVQYHRRETLR
jgi:hypothetical protein